MKLEIQVSVQMEDAEDGGIERRKKCDILMFRGEMLDHSLTSVTLGLRQIIQIELCREKEGRTE